MLVLTFSHVLGPKLLYNPFKTVIRKTKLFKGFGLSSTISVFI